jgi:hypothetical protein
MTLRRPNSGYSTGKAHLFGARLVLHWHKEVEKASTAIRLPEIGRPTITCYRALSGISAYETKGAG